MKEGFFRRYLPEFVYGGIDGSITTFAIICGAIGASLGAGVALVLGIANLFADGFSMAVSNYLSVKSQVDLHRNHSNRKKYQNLNKHAFRTGLATFISFVIVGFIPLFSFVLSLFFPIEKNIVFIISAALTAVSFLIVGYVKGIIVKRHPVKSAFETLLIGVVASILAFLVGYLLREFVSV